MKKITASTIFFIISYFTYGYSQEIGLNWSNNQKVEILSNPLYRSEISLFSQSKIKDSLPILLVEYPIYNCSPNHVNFTKKGVNRIIRIKKTEDLLTEISFVHIKYQLQLPHSAFSDIYISKFCDYKASKKVVKPNKATKNITAQCAKSFGSKDGKRVYLYLINTDILYNYEVIWIIENGKYVGRIVDNLLK